MVIFWCIRFLQLLALDRSPLQIAFGITFGMLLGVIPVTTLHWFCLLGCLFVVRMNLLAALLSAACFGLLSWILQSPIEELGYWTLTANKSLLPLWARAYHAPVLPFTAFNYSSVMGGTLIAFACFIPLLLLSQILIRKWSAPLHTFWLSTRIQRAYTHYRRMTH